MTEDSRSQRERMLAGDFYYAQDEQLVQLRARATRLTQMYSAVDATDVAKRTRILNELFGAFGAGSYIVPPFFCDYGSHIRIGSNVEINFGLTVLDCANVTIGDNVLIGPNVQIYSATHPIEPEYRRDKWELAQPITINDNVWLGGGVVVCPGVTIGENTVVGAGSVVTKDLPANVLVAGNPASIKRILE